jgi:hypothetical protein
MINYIKQFFSHKEKTTVDDSIVDLIISLNKKNEINISLFIDDKDKLNNDDLINYSEKCAEFFNIVNSGKLKKQILDILLNQIKKENNQLLIDNIVVFWTIIDKQRRKQKSEIAFVNPTEVFTKYILK